MPPPRGEHRPQTPGRKETPQSPGRRLWGSANSRFPGQPRPSGVQAPPGAAPRPLLQGRFSALQGGGGGEDTQLALRMLGQEPGPASHLEPPMTTPRMAPQPELGADWHQTRRRPSSSARRTLNRPGLSAAPSPGPARSPARGRGRGPRGVTQGPAPSVLLRRGCPEQPWGRVP